MVGHRGVRIEAFLIMVAADRIRAFLQRDRIVIPRVDRKHRIQRGFQVAHLLFYLLGDVDMGLSVGLIEDIGHHQTGIQIKRILFDIMMVEMNDPDLVDLDALPCQHPAMVGIEADVVGFGKVAHVGEIDIPTVFDLADGRDLDPESVGLETPF